MKTKVYVVTEYKVFSSDPPIVKIFDQGNIEEILDYTSAAYKRSASDNNIEVTNGLVEVESADMSWVDNSAEFDKAVEATIQIAKGIHRCKENYSAFRNLVNRNDRHWEIKNKIDSYTWINYCPFCGEKLQ